MDKNKLTITIAYDRDAKVDPLTIVAEVRDGLILNAYTINPEIIGHSFERAE